MNRLARTIQILALTAVAVAFSCHPAQGTTSPRGTAMASADTLNAFFSTYHADGGSSVPLGDGRVLWLFGDTIRSDGSMDRNSAAIQTGTTFTPLEGTFAQPPTAGHWYWPGQAVREGTNLRILWQDFYRTGDGAWDFHYDHTDVVTYSLPDLQLMTRTPLPRRSSGAMWGQLVRAANGYTYVYGAYSVEGEIGKAFEVARVPNGRLASASAWQYLGTKLPPSMELGTVASVIRAPSGYRLFSKRLDLWTDDIIAYDAKSPTGPWVNKRVVATTPHVDGQWTYAVEAHPEQGVLTYATNCEVSCPEYGLTAISM